MEPFYRLKNLNTRMLSGALVVLALALFIPFSTYVTQQRNATTPQAGNTSTVAKTSMVLSHHQFDCSKGDSLNGIPSGTDCNQIMTGRIFAVDVQIRSDIDAANLVNAELTYQPKSLTVEKIVIKGNGTQVNPSEGKNPKVAGDFFISSWVNQKFNNDQGSVQLVGAVPTPGFITRKENPPALMARIYFKALTSGQTSITIDESSAIFRNADNANILKSKQNLSFSVK